MSTKVKGDKIKECSVSLNALLLGDKLIQLFEPNGNVLNILKNNIYYNFPFPLPPTQNVLYCVTHGSIIELKKGTTVELQNGPTAYLTWDDNGVKISNDAEYYDIECYNNIDIKSNITIVDPVVWKYITEPCYIIPGSPISEDLANIIYDYESNMFNSIIKNVCVFYITTEEGDCFEYIFCINLSDDVVYTMDNTKTIFKYKYNRTSRIFTEY